MCDQLGRVARFDRVGQLFDLAIVQIQIPVRGRGDISEIDGDHNWACQVDVEKVEVPVLLQETVIGRIA